MVIIDYMWALIHPFGIEKVYSIFIRFHFVAILCWNFILQATIWKQFPCPCKGWCEMFSYI